MSDMQYKSLFSAIGGDVYFRRQVASDPDLTKCVGYQLLFRDDDYEVRQHLAKNPFAKECEEYSIMMADPRYRVILEYDKYPPILKNENDEHDSFDDELMNVSTPKFPFIRDDITISIEYELVKNECTDYKIKSANFIFVMVKEVEPRSRSYEKNIRWKKEDDYDDQYFAICDMLQRCSRLGMEVFKRDEEYSKITGFFKELLFDSLYECEMECYELVRNRSEAEMNSFVNISKINQYSQISQNKE